MREIAVALVALVLGLSASAQTEMPPPDGPILYSHYEFSRLSEDQRVAYLKMLRDLLNEAEKDQTSRGVTYGTAMNSEIRPLFDLLFKKAEAQTQWVKGGTCVFAGGFSTYAQAGTKSCINNRPCGEKKEIRCNPLLYGDICTRAADGGTARCDRERKITDEDLAKDLAQPEKRKEWDAFKAEFDGFCTGVMKSSKDQNFKSCKRIEARIQALEKKLALLPPARTQATPVAGAQPLQVKLQPTKVDCTAAPSHGCLTCTGFSTARSARELKRSDLQGKYAELIDVMTGICRVQNKTDSGNQGVSAKSTEALIQKYGACKNLEYTGGDKFESPEQKKLLTDLAQGNSSALKEAAGGIWLNPYSEAMQGYFGFNVKEARQAFCTNASASDAAKILSGYPEFGFLFGSGAAVNMPEILKDEAPLKHAPPWAHEMKIDRMDGRNAVDALNRFKAQYFQRKQLAKCLQANDSDKTRRQASESRLVLPSCVLESANVEAENLEPVAAQMLKQYGHVGIEIQGQPPVCCTGIDPQGRPNCVMPKGAAARVARMNCSNPTANAGQGSAWGGSTTTK